MRWSYLSSIIHCIISLHRKQPQKKKHWLNWKWQTFKTQKHTTTFSYFSYTLPPSMIAGISSNTWLALSICSSYLPDVSCCIDLVQQCSFMKYSKHETYSISRGYLYIYIYVCDLKKNIIYRKRFKYQMYIMFNIKTYVIQGLTAARTCPNPPTTWWFLCCEALS